MNNKTLLSKLLDDKEKRDDFENTLCETYYNFTLITIKSNYAGSNKNTIESHLISYTMFIEVMKTCDVKNIFANMTTEGLIFFILTKEKPEIIKKITTHCEENHELGRLVDIDVRIKAKTYSRADLNLPVRKCFLCNNNANICVRNKTHILSNVLDFTNKAVYKNLFSKKANNNGLLANISTAALLEELCRPFGFGCVTVNNSGSHTDMNFLFMLQCFPIIQKSITDLTIEDIKDFYSLRVYGKLFEKKLLEQTKGVNTYKGALFLLLILNACTLKCNSFSKLSETIKDFCKPLVKDFENSSCSDISLQSFQSYNEMGIRGEVLTGFEKHFKTYLPMLESKAPIEKIILKILSETHDTTTIKRGGYKKLLEIQKISKQVKTYEDIKKLNEFCITNNLSTGGTADKLIVLYNLYLIKRFFYGE